MKKILVAYFSASGTTAKLAQRLAKTLQADLYEISPKTPYTTADLNWTDRNSRSSVEMRNPDCRPPLKTQVPDVATYETVFIGFPVWWYREPSIIDTFLEACRLDGKTLIPFATSGGSGLGNTAENLQKLAPNAHVKTGKRFAANTPDAELSAWAQKMLS